ncbi:MAG: YtxH domain-containing protein [Chitinophagaceae bacterium]|nr:YtxH domain-containing protein [Chitinophagaceae bacterium]
MNSTSKIIAATLAGVATGALLGLLFAPDKGEETRRKISEKYTDLNDTIRNKVADLVDTIKNEYGHVKDTVNDYTGRGPANMKAEPKDTFKG